MQIPPCGYAHNKNTHGRKHCLYFHSNPHFLLVLIPTTDGEQAHCRIYSIQLTIQKYKDTACRGAEPQTGAAPQDTQDLENMVSSVWE